MLASLLLRRAACGTSAPSQSGIVKLCRGSLRAPVLSRGAFPAPPRRKAAGRSCASWSPSWTSAWSSRATSSLCGASACTAPVTTALVRVEPLAGPRAPVLVRDPGTEAGVRPSPMGTPLLGRKGFLGEGLEASVGTAAAAPVAKGPGAVRHCRLLGSTGRVCLEGGPSFSAGGVLDVPVGDSGTPCRCRPGCECSSASSGSRVGCACEGQDERRLCLQGC